MRTFNDNWAVRSVHTPGQHAANAHYGSWINMTGFRRIAFLPHTGNQTDNVVWAAYEATSAAGANATLLTGLTGTNHDTVDDGFPGIIEVREADLTVGYPYVTLLCTPAASTDLSCVAVLGEAYEDPVSNAVADGVAFNVGE